MTIRFPLLALDERCRGGLILCRGPVAEFAGPGSVVYSPGEGCYSEAIALGETRLLPIVTAAARRRAYQRRIQWQRWLQRLASLDQAEQRVEELLSSLKGFFSTHAVQTLPNQAIANLVGVLPVTVQKVRSHYVHLSSAPWQVSGPVPGQVPEQISGQVSGQRDDRRPGVAVPAVAWPDSAGLNPIHPTSPTARPGRSSQPSRPTNWDSLLTENAWAGSDPGLDWAQSLYSIDGWREAIQDLAWAV